MDGFPILSLMMAVPMMATSATPAVVAVGSMKDPGGRLGGGVNGTVGWG